jgi:hypothetical protein
MKNSKLLFAASWILLLLLCGAVTLAALGSLGTAYFGAQDVLIPAVTLDEIRNLGGEEAVDAFRGRRATAASWAFGCGVLSMLVTLVPYRRAERWAWWALLLSLGLSQMLSLSRVLTLGTTSGANTAGILFGTLMLGLLLGAPRMFAERSRDVAAVK